MYEPTYMMRREVDKKLSEGISINLYDELPKFYYISLFVLEAITFNHIEVILHRNLYDEFNRLLDADLETTLNR